MGAIGAVLPQCPGVPLPADRTRTGNDREPMDRLGHQCIGWWRIWGMLGPEGLATGAQRREGRSVTA